MNNRTLLQGLVIFFTSLLAFIFLFHQLVPIAEPLLTKKDYEVTEPSRFHYVALGDSLTQGVGDSTGQGGFVPLLSQSLTNEYGYELTTDNYGVSGNTSQQILKRMKEDPEIGTSLKNAQLMTLTVGGNDLRKIILDNILELEVDTFDQPQEDYSQRLEEIITLARKDNPDLPIYVLGIYNPFYINFPEMTEMQIIVDNWNQTTEETVSELDRVYFVPINDLLYLGIDGQGGISEEDSSEVQETNNLLYEEDHFHPNNTGYEIMKEAVMEKIRETKKEWTEK